MTTMAERIQGLLSARKMSQTELARAVNLTSAAISRYVGGNREPRSVILLAIAKALGTSTDYLLGNSIEPFIATVDDDVAQIKQLLLRSRAQMTAEQKCGIVEILVCGGRR